MTSITAGAAPSGITNFSIQNVNLAAGTAQLCGTDTNAPLTTGSPGTMAPVATNTRRQRDGQHSDRFAAGVHLDGRRGRRHVGLHVRPEPGPRAGRLPVGLRFGDLQR